MPSVASPAIFRGPMFIKKTASLCSSLLIAIRFCRPVRIWGWLWGSWILRQYSLWLFGTRDT